MLVTIQDYIDAKLTHSRHTTESRSFRGCRRRWNWIFNEFYYPVLTPKPLEFGVAYHCGMEVLYAPSLWDKPEEVVVALAQKAFVDTCAEQYKKYVEHFGDDPEVEEDYKERVELGREMLEYAAKTTRRKDKEEELTPVLVEVKFEVPLEENGEQIWCTCKTCFNRFLAWVEENDPEWLAEVNFDETVEGAGRESYRQLFWQGLPVTYGGRIDAILKGPDGRIWVVDWKTAKQLSEETAVFLLLDDQITRYLAAMKKCGYRVAGFIYHEQKKAVPSEPKLLTRRVKGKLFSTNKAEANFTLETFVKTVEENDPEGYDDGAYNEFINWLHDNPTKFHERHRVPRNDNELDEAWESLTMEALDMSDPNLRIYKNAGRFNCNNCAFRQPCLGKNNGEDYLYTLKTLFEKRKYHYYEDAPLATEQGGRAQ